MFFKNPHTGHFLSADPMGYGGGLNIYSYVGNNPANWIDPLGLDSVSGSNEFGEFATYLEPSEGVKIHKGTMYFGIGMRFSPEGEDCCCDTIDFVQMIRMTKNGDITYLNKKHKKRAIEEKRYGGYLLYGGYTLDVLDTTTTPYWIGGTYDPERAYGTRGQPIYEEAPGPIGGFFDVLDNPKFKKRLGCCNSKKNGTDFAEFGDVVYLSDWIPEKGPGGKGKGWLYLEGETCAICTEGAQEGRIYGCVNWTAEREYGGKLILWAPRIPMVLPSTPTEGMIQALRNASEQMGWKGMKNIDKWLNKEKK